MDLLQAFEEYVDAASTFRKAAEKYSNCFYEITERELNEQILNEKFSLKEKKALEVRIKDLKNKVQNTYTELLNKVNLVQTALKRELYTNIHTIKELNKLHVAALKDYAIAISDFIDLEKDYPNRNFKEDIDIVDMTRQFRLLNRAIEDFNFRLMSDSKVKLLTTDECIDIVEDKFVNIKEIQKQYF